MIEEFDKIEFEILCQRIASGELCGAGIGTLGEKRLHKILKYYMCPDESKHEVRIGKDGVANTSKEKNGAVFGKGGYIADILDGDNIIEIQTGSFYPLKPKIKFYIENSDYKITIVHPIAATKWVKWINPECGEISKGNRSPKKGRVTDVMPELFWLSEWIKNDRLKFQIMLLEIDEYRLLDGWSKDKKRGSNRYDRIPVALCDIVEITPNNLLQTLIPQGLSEKFTSGDISRLTGLKGRKLSCSIKLLCDLGLISRGERTAKGYTYECV